MKSCKIHVTKAFINILCQHLSPGGAWYISDPMMKLDRPKLTIESLGEAVLKVLEASSRLSASPDLEIIQKAMLDFVGFKSWGAFANATETCCSVRLDAGRITITPSFRDGHGFSGDGKRAINCDPTAGVLGKVLFNVLGLEN